MNDHTLSGGLNRWEAVIDDMEATAAEYREEGWEALELHPGDVTALPATPEIETEQVGLDVLVPDNEFEELSSLVESADFDEYEVFRAQEGDVVFLVLAMQDPNTERAVLVPLYYTSTDAQYMIPRVRDAGRMQTYVRPLSDEERVVFTQTDPDNLLPVEE